jgi:hypothetical protein
MLLLSSSKIDLRVITQRVFGPTLMGVFNISGFDAVATCSGKHLKAFDLVFAKSFVKSKVMSNQSYCSSRFTSSERCNVGSCRNVSTDARKWVPDCSLKIWALRTY